MVEMEKVFVDRDNMSAREARETCDAIREEMYDIINEGGTYEDVEDLFLNYGLEMDYLMDLI